MDVQLQSLALLTWNMRDLNIMKLALTATLAKKLLKIRHFTPLNKGSYVKFATREIILVQVVMKRLSEHQLSWSLTNPFIRNATNAISVKVHWGLNVKTIFII